MNEELREEIIEDLGLAWCAVTNDYVHRDCFKLICAIQRLETFSEVTRHVMSLLKI